MYEMTMNSGAVVSVSAATKAQVANAEILFGKNAKVLIKRIDELVKIKELDTSKLEAILDILKDTEATNAFVKKAAGKNAVTAIKNLYKAKTLVATINGLRAIKIKVTAPNDTAKAAVKPQRVAKTKGDTGTKPAKVVAQRVNQNASLPKIDLARIGPKFMNNVTQTQIDSIAAALSEATGLTFVGEHTPSNGQSSDWTFSAANPNARYREIHIDPPYEFHEYERSTSWHIGATTNTGGIVIGQELRRPTPAAFAAAITKLVGKVGTPGAKGKKAATVTAGAVAFDPAYSVLRTQTASKYAPKFIRAVEPTPGAAKLLRTTGNQFSFEYKGLEVSVVMKQKGWLMTFIGDHLKKVQNVQIHLGELESIKNVIELFATKDPTAAQAQAAIKKGLRKL
ncbi:hypothetical protein MPK64_gp178 [Erwinia phage pEa_SNUABM_16]|uniref:Uncharacterized protein n=1 Tax=Erwinia phage pEa_SNUABM_16 TaxID=2869544 RepID=A0AAE8XQZ6_9CAUD|nr:hypothetical protein MPK64_gp178 [Erwinia phage pEa_SNUABM_16]QZE59081.1 hypothetical protein pEaSNUABM18_00178 [Erwinia phage pEa_SNUABM_18]UAW96322.1 hypothetical protein pEaSNUABM16_00178 [Erwinia phage pEa_SNUABM_16]